MPAVHSLQAVTIKFEMNDANFYEKPSHEPPAETRLYVMEAITELSRDMTKLIQERAEALHKVFDDRRVNVNERLRILEDDRMKKQGAKAVWIFISSLAGGIISGILILGVKLLIK
jgi:hypothetical protein